MLHLLKKMRPLILTMAALLLIASFAGWPALAAGDEEAVETVASEILCEEEAPAEPEPAIGTEAAAEPENVGEPVAAAEPENVGEPVAAAEPENVGEPVTAAEPETVGETAAAEEPESAEESVPDAETEPVENFGSAAGTDGGKEPQEASGTAEKPEASPAAAIPEEPAAGEEPETPAAEKADKEVPEEEQEPEPAALPEGGEDVLTAREESPADAAEDGAKESEGPAEEGNETAGGSVAEESEDGSGSTGFADGTYVPSFTFSGGSGKVKITCPKVVVKDGKGTATIVFDSSNYTYVLVGEEKYYNENSGGDSTFTIPVNINADTNISAETTAMSTPHLISYVLTVSLDGQAVPAEPEDPEDPEDPEEPEDPAEPEGVVQVTVVKENGEEFKMFQAKASTAVLNGDRIDIDFVTENYSFDKIYIGSKSDEEKTPVFTGTQRDKGFRFRFSVDRALNGTQTEVALGKTDGTWYKNYTLFLVIPDLEAEPETPDDPADPEEPAAPEEPEEPDDPAEPEEPTDPETPGEQTDPETPGEQTGPEAPEEPMISEEGVLADGIYTAEVETGQLMFKVVNCVITSEDGKMTAVIALSGTGYDFLYLGTGKEAFAADGEGWIPFKEDPETGKYTYTLELATVTEPTAVASRSARYASEGRGEAAWLDRTITIVPESIVKTADLPQEGEQDEPADPSDGPSADPSGGEKEPDSPGNDGDKEKEAEKEEPENKGTQDKEEIRKMEENTKKGTVADGTYVPSFGFTGGTGKVSISCPKLVVKNGKGTATLVFSSSKYTYVMVNGTKYYNENSGGKSTFTIPVNVNTTTSVSAETTAMSEAHVIDYVLYIYVDGQDVSNIRPSASGSSADEEKPEDGTEQAETEDEEEEFGPDGGAKGNSGWGEYDSIQTTDDPPPEEDTAVPATGAEDTDPEAEQEEPAVKKGFSAWYGIGIAAAVVLLAGGGFAAMRKGKKKA